MNVPTFKIRDSGGEPSDHEAVHVVYVRELWAEKERLRIQLDALKKAGMNTNAEFCSASPPEKH